ncbi:hypothetical protein QLX08_008389 [Tetragonisca angustula]|uniref:Uncharacterized protein n=1 Tax=Tetragonisca angustula TaxID=166442 RepID=A0AAW0ZKI8_9HYME
MPVGKFIRRRFSTRKTTKPERHVTRDRGVIREVVSRGEGRQKKPGVGSHLASAINTRAGSSDVTSGHLPNKQKPRNRTLSAGNDFEKEEAADDDEHV